MAHDEICCISVWMLRAVAQAHRDPLPHGRTSQKSSFAAAFAAIEETAYLRPMLRAQACQVQPRCRQLRRGDGELPATQCAETNGGIKLRTNVRKEVADRVSVGARFVEGCGKHDACITAAAILRRRKNGAETDAGQPHRPAMQRAFVPLERRNASASVVKADGAVMAAAITASRSLERLSDVLLETAASRP
jgi:hypothetical protein